MQLIRDRQAEFATVSGRCEFNTASTAIWERWLFRLRDRHHRVRRNEEVEDLHCLRSRAPQQVVERYCDAVLFGIGDRQAELPDGSCMVHQHWAPNHVVKIPLGGGTFGFGQMLDRPEYAFFDLRMSSGVSPEDVVARPVLFRLWVAQSAHTSGRWTRIGSGPLSDALKKKVDRFNQDPLRPTQIRLTRDGVDGPLVTPSECVALERAAVWDAEQVEDRLRDHFEGRPNRWVESLRIRA